MRAFFIALLVGLLAHVAAAQTKSEREQAGLLGDVQSVEWVQYWGEVLRYKFTYKYDNKGRLREQEMQEFNGNPNVHVSHAPVPGKIVYAYDDEKRTKEVVSYKPDGTPSGRVVYTYNDRGDEVGRLEFKGDGSPKHQEIRWYDQSTLLRTLSGQSLVKYEYDARGNWTRKTYLIRPADGGKPEAFRTEYRVITYR